MSQPSSIFRTLGIAFAALGLLLAIGCGGEEPEPRKRRKRKKPPVEESPPPEEVAKGSEMEQPEVSPAECAAAVALVRPKIQELLKQHDYHAALTLLRKQPRGFSRKTYEDKIVEQRDTEVRHYIEQARTAIANADRRLAKRKLRVAWFFDPGGSRVERAGRKLHISTSFWKK